MTALHAHHAPSRIRWSAPPQAVLFDLDGTLADTAGDLVGALNRLRVQRGVPPMPLIGAAISTTSPAGSR